MVLFTSLFVLPKDNKLTIILILMLGKITLTEIAGAADVFTWWISSLAWEVS